VNAGGRACLALVGAVALAVPAVSATATPSAANGGQISVNTGSGWTHEPTTPLFDFSRIAPGWSGTASLDVRNDSDTTAAITLRASHVVEDENGCNHPESVVDTTCTGDNAGELGKEIVLSVFPGPGNDGTFAATSTWTGTIEDLANGATLASDLGPADVASYKVTAELPRSSGNETQTDQVGFDMVVGLDGAAGVAVEGTKITRHGTSTLRGIADHLPFTGPLAMRLAAAGLSLLFAGLALILLATQRRRRMGPV